MTRRKRNHSKNNSPYPHAYLRKPLADSMDDRPSASRVMDNAVWEVEMDEHGGSAHTVRIAIPLERSDTRAFFPAPLTLHTREAKRIAQRWMNRIFDAHYTLDGLALQVAGQEVSAGSEGIVELITESGRVLEHAYRGFESVVERLDAFVLMTMEEMDDAVENPSYNDKLTCVAAISAPMDRRFVSLLRRVDALGTRLDILYLMGILPADQYGVWNQEIGQGMESMCQTIADNVRHTSIEIRKMQRAARKPRWSEI